METLKVRIPTIYFKVCKRRIVICALGRRSYWDTVFEIPSEYRGVYRLTKSFSWEIDKLSLEFLKQIVAHCEKVSPNDPSFKQWLAQYKQEAACHG